MFTTVLFLLASLCLLCVAWTLYAATKTENRFVVPFICLVAGVLDLIVAGAEVGQGSPRLINRLTTNAIYEVVSATPVKDEQWLILRDQDGDCLVYHWQGQAPTGVVKTVRREGGPNYYDLVPYPPPATQPK